MYLVIEERADDSLRVHIEADKARGGVLPFVCSMSAAPVPLVVFTVNNTGGIQFSLGKKGNQWMLVYPRAYGMAESRIARLPLSE